VTVELQPLNELYLHMRLVFEQARHEESGLWQTASLNPQVPDSGVMEPDRRVKIAQVFDETN